MMSLFDSRQAATRDAAVVCRQRRTLGLALSLSLLLPTGLPAHSAPATDNDEPREGTSFIFSARVDPIVIRAGVETFRLELGMSVGLPIQIARLSVPPDTLNQHGQPAEILILQDNGFSGDRIAHDGIFTAQGIGIADPDGVLGAVELRFGTAVELEFADGTRQSFVQDLGLSFRYMDPSLPDVERVNLARMWWPHLASCPWLLLVSPAPFRGRTSSRMRWRSATTISSPMIGTF